jgi:hypothetical protein
MFTKIKEFLFGKDPVQSPVAAPYKVEVVPAGTEASVAAPVAEKPKAPTKPVSEKKPSVPKAPPKPRAPRKPVAK